MTYEYEKYVATKETLKGALEKYGVAIIPNVLSGRECQRMVDGMWDTLEHITQSFDPNTTPGPISRDDESTWRSFYELYPLHYASTTLSDWPCSVCLGSSTESKHT